MYTYIFPAKRLVDQTTNGQTRRKDGKSKKLKNTYRDKQTGAPTDRFRLRNRDVIRQTYSRTDAGNNLISILDIETNEIIQMPPSLYFEVNELKTLRNATGTNKQMSILGMNIQSIHATFQELEVFIETLQNFIFLI